MHATGTINRSPEHLFSKTHYIGAAPSHSQLQTDGYYESTERSCYGHTELLTTQKYEADSQPV